MSHYLGSHRWLWSRGLGDSARERAAPGILGPCAAYMYAALRRESRISLIAFLAALSTRSFIRLAYRPYRPSRSPSIRPPVSTSIWWKRRLADGSPLRSRLPHMLFTPFAKTGVTTRSPSRALSSSARLGYMLPCRLSHSLRPPPSFRLSFNRPPNALLFCPAARPRQLDIHTHKCRELVEMSQKRTHFSMKDGGFTCGNLTQFNTHTAAYHARHCARSADGRWKHYFVRDGFGIA